MELFCSVVHGIVGSAVVQILQHGLDISIAAFRTASIEINEFQPVLILQPFHLSTAVLKGIHHVIIPERIEVENRDDEKVRHPGEIVVAPLHIAGIHFCLVETVVPGQVEVLLQMGLQVIDIGEPCPVPAFRFLHLYIHPYPAVSGVLRGQGILRHDLDLSNLALEQHGEHFPAESLPHFLVHGDSIHKEIVQDIQFLKGLVAVAHNILLFRQAAWV